MGMLFGQFIIYYVCGHMLVLLGSTKKHTVLELFQHKTFHPNLHMLSCRSVPATQTCRWRKRVYHVEQWHLTFGKTTSEKKQQKNVSSFFCDYDFIFTQEKSRNLPRHNCQNTLSLSQREKKYLIEVKSGGEKSFTIVWHVYMWNPPIPPF